MLIIEIPFVFRYTYCLWFSRRAPGKHAAPQSFDQNLRMVGRFASVEQFWSYYCHLVRPCELSGHSDFHLFKDGIKPMWEVVLLNNNKDGEVFINLLCFPTG
jgi:translation initiation factor 4E